MFSEKVSQFTYKIRESLIDENFIKVDEELKKTKNIIVFATWDDNMKYEHTRHSDQRLRGLCFSNSKFEEMRKFIKEVDEFCVDNPNYRIILLSKKAQGWSQELKSNFFDLREFEQLGLNFSQALFLSIKNSIADIGQWCSMQTFLSFDENLKHLVYKDNLTWNHGKYVGTIFPYLNYYSIDGNNNENFLNYLKSNNE